MEKLTLNKKLLQRMIFTITITIVVLGFFVWVVQAQSQNFIRDDEIFIETPDFTELEPTYDRNGFIISEPIPRLVLVADENQTKQSVRIPLDESIDLSVKGSSFEITYVPAGEKDVWGEVVCLPFPESAKTAFNYAANIWAATITSTVPITIKACWANLGESYILGYSGGYNIYRDFSGAPFSNTWYASSLANSLHGSDLGPSAYDMHITYNTNFNWYFGTDAIPTPGTMDFVTVAAHEIAHGLNFSGTASYSSGVGSFGWSGYPSIYDRFMRDGSGTLLTSYTNPSVALGTLLISNNLWFHGSNAMAANSGNRVKMYAPTSWSAGSSYSHLDYSTFSGTLNNMMVYAILYGAANHNPGPVTIGLLKDLGWNLIAAVPTGVQASDGTDPTKVVVSWNPSTNATYYQVFRNTSDSTTGAITLTNNHSSSPYNDTTAIAGTLYYYWVNACNASSCSDYSLPDSGYRATTVLTAPTGVEASDGTYSDKVRVSWNSSAGATHYQVFRNTTNSPSAAVQLIDDYLESPYDDSTAIVDTTYYYWLKACDLSTCSNFSLYDTGYKSSTPVNAPTGVSASDGDYVDRVRISWNAVAGANKYKVFRNTSNTTNGAFEFPDIITVNSFDDLSAAQGSTYYFWVQACSNSGCSEYSTSDSGYLKSLQTSWNIYLPLLNKNYADIDPIKNGDFELGRDGSWTEYSSNGWKLILNSEYPPDIYPHGGSWLTWLGGDDYETSRLSQSVLISSSRPYLHYWYWIGSEDICGYDFFRFKVNSSLVIENDLCGLTSTNKWVEQVVNLSPFAGSTVTLTFEVTTDDVWYSNFFLDDIIMSNVATTSTAVVDETQKLGDVTRSKKE
jgi:fibronectin type 3 domain-containing protein